MTKGDLISKSELLKEFDPNGNRLNPIFVRSRIVQAKSISDAEIRAKAIDEFTEKFIYKAVCEGCSGCCCCYEESRQSECEDWKSYMEIAEQMKGGAV